MSSETNTPPVEANATCGAISPDPVQRGVACTLLPGHRGETHYHRPTRAMWGLVFELGTVTLPKDW